MAAVPEVAVEDHSKSSKDEESNRFNLLFFRRLGRLLRVFFPSWRDATVLLFVFLMGVVLLEQVVIYQVGLVPSRFYKVLGERDKPDFKAETVRAIMLVVGMAFVRATKKYSSSVFYVTSREYVTRHLHKQYFRDILYYHVNVLDTRVDNPDQRITQDVEKMCNNLSQITPQLLLSPFIISYYTYKTWSNMGYIGPTIVLVFFVMSTVVNKFLMSPVVALVFRQEKLEGDFRFKHMMIRSNAESAAFLRCGRVELEKTDDKLLKLIKTQQILVLKEYLLNFSVFVADYLGSILSYIILAVPIFSGQYDYLTPAELGGLISANAFVTIYLINCFTQLIDMAVQVTDIAGSTHRIGQLLECLTDLIKVTVDDAPSDGCNDAYISSTSFDNGHAAYILNSVSYGAPGSDRVLVKNLNLSISRGINTLITGPSGCGKSSLLRVLDGLWSTSSGSTERLVSHGRRGVCFLPQRPFFTDGTLREQIIYPCADNGSSVGVDDHEIMQYLEETNLMSLHVRLGGLDAPCEWNWYDMLSPGEMQRLSFIRLFYHRPPYAVLDEATSQLGLDMETKLYKTCGTLDITVVSVGHRDSLRQFHSQELRLDARGGWSLCELKPAIKLHPPKTDGDVSAV